MNKSTDAEVDEIKYTASMCSNGYLPFSSDSITAKISNQKQKVKIQETFISTKSVILHNADTIFRVCASVTSNFIGEGTASMTSSKNSRK